MKPNLYLTLLLLVVAASAYGQSEILFDRTEPKGFSYTLNNVQGSSANTIREMLQSLNGIAFDLRYAQQTRVIRNGFGIEATTQFKDLRVENAPQYRGFPALAAFLPESVNLTAELTSNGKRVKMMNFPQVAVVEGGINPLSFGVTDSTGTATFNLEIRDVEWVYGNTAKKRVNDFTRDVKEYEQAAKDLNGMRNELYALNVTTPDPETLVAVADRLKAIGANLTAINKAPFWNGLQLDVPNAIDPQALFLLQQSLATELSQRSAAIAQKLANIHLLLYEKAAAMLDKNLPNDARRYAEQAIGLRADFAPAHHLIARLDFNANDLKRAAERLRQSLNNFPQDDFSRQEAAQLINLIKERWIDEARKDMAAGQYAPARQRLADAELLCYQTRFVTCTGNDPTKVRKESWQKEYDEVYGKATDAYQKGRYEEALPLIERAAAFYQANRSEIADPRRIQQLRGDSYEALYADYFNQAIVQSQATDPSSLLLTLQKAETFYQEHRQDFVVSDKTLNLKRLAVGNGMSALYNKGEDAYNRAQGMGNQANFDSELSSLAEADRYAADAQRFYQEYSGLLSSDLGVTGFRREIATATFSATYRKAEYLLQSGRLEEALSLSQKAKQLQNQADVIPNYNADRLEQRVQYERYTAIVREGDQLKNSGREKEAIAQYNLAKDLQQRYRLGELAGGNMPALENVDSKIQDAAKSRLIAEADQALAAFAKNNKQLNPALDKAKADLLAYGLSGDPSAVAAINRLQSGVCDNAYDELSGLKGGAQRAMQNKDYFTAKSVHTEADALQAEYSFCNLPATWIEEWREEITKCAAYQDQLQTARKALVASEGEKAVQGFLAAATLHQAPIVNSQFSAEPEFEVVDFAKQNNNASFKAAAAQYAADVNRFEEAWMLYISALEKGEGGTLRLFQEKMGDRLARIDRMNGKDWKTGLAERVPSFLKRQLKSFSAAYKRKAKSL